MSKKLIGFIVVSITITSLTFFVPQDKTDTCKVIKPNFSDSANAPSNVAYLSSYKLHRHGLPWSYYQTAGSVLVTTAPTEDLAKGCVPKANFKGFNFAKDVIIWLLASALVIYGIRKVRK